MSSPAVVTPQQQFTAPAAPHGDPSAVRAMAAAYRALAAEVRDSQRAVEGVFHALGASWQGEGQRASSHPVAVVAADAERVANGLEEVASVLDRHAAELEHAQHAHHFAWGKLLKVGAVVVLSAGLIVVTAGTAAPEVAAADSLIIGGEVGAMTAATGSATAAASSTAGALFSAARVLTALRGLAAVARPALPWATGFTGLDAVKQEWSDGRLDVNHVAIEFGISLVLPSALGRATKAVRSVELLADRPVASAAAKHLTVGGVVGSSEAAREQLETGRVRPAGIGRAAAQGAGLSLGGQVLKHVLPSTTGESGSGFRPSRTSVVAQAPRQAQGWLGPRQPATEALTDPLNLHAHEGKKFGHTIKKHVGKTAQYLQDRLDKGKSVVSTFHTVEDANNAVQRVLRTNAEEVRERTLAAEDGDVTYLYGRANGNEGWILTAAGDRPEPTQIVVQLMKRNNHTFVLTSYLE